MTVHQLTDANFQAEVLDAEALVLVDVWAAWCGPCRLMAPLMEWAASTYGEGLRVGKLEADPNPVVRDQLQIKGLPTLILFKNGEVAAQKVGALAKSQLTAFIDSNI